MRRKHAFSLPMSNTGVALLVAATPNFRSLTSNRVHNVVFSHYLGGPLLNAMSVR